MLLVRPLLMGPTVALVITQVLHREYASCCAAATTSSRMLGCRVRTWLGFQRLYSRMLPAQAAARSAAHVCDQWLNRPPVQLTLSAAVSCIPTFWFHGPSHLVRIFILKLTGPRITVTTASCWWRVVRLASSQVYVSK